MFFCIIALAMRNLLLFFDKNYADKKVLPQNELRYYHTDNSALCADGVRKYGFCSQKHDK